MKCAHCSSFQSKWFEFFPTIISKTRTVEVLATGMAGRSGSLLLVSFRTRHFAFSFRVACNLMLSFLTRTKLQMYEELHVLSPVVPTREFCFLRYCQQIEQGLWAIADVSVDLSRESNQFNAPSRSRRLPSGCLIQEMPNGYSKVIIRACYSPFSFDSCTDRHVSEKFSTQVTWIEHMEIEEKAPIHLLFRDLVGSGAAFGAHRWLTTLQRTCERFACLMAAGASPRDIGGGDFATNFSRLAVRKPENSYLL